MKDLLLKRLRKQKAYDPLDELTDDELNKKIEITEAFLSKLKRKRKNRQNSLILKKLHADPEFQKRHKARHSAIMKSRHGELLELPPERRKIYTKLVRNGISRAEALKSARAQ